jgi:hypothetical protein
MSTQATAEVCAIREGRSLREGSVIGARCATSVCWTRVRDLDLARRQERGIREAIAVSAVCHEAACQRRTNKRDKTVKERS